MITPKRVLLFKAVLLSVAAIALPIVLLFAPGRNGQQLPAALGLGGVFLLISIIHWWKYQRMPAETQFYDIRKQPPQEQIRVSKRAIWSMLALGPLGSFWTYHQLSKVEDGTMESVRTWAPIAELYNHFGFWPAVLFWPVFSMFILGAALYRLRKASEI